LEYSEKKNVRIASLGIDSATFDLILPWLSQGELPILQSLLQTGSWGVLESTIPPLSPIAWSSFMTGVNPGKHGIFGFKEIREDSYSYRFVNNNHIKSKTLWKLLSERGKKVIIVNIPFTYPPETVDGILIAGMDSPGLDSDFTHPITIKNELLREIPDYKIHLHTTGALHNDRKREGAIRDLTEMVKARGRAACYLLENYEWDFFAINFSAVDQVQHHFWRFMEDGAKFSDAILRIYRQVDQSLGDIIRVLDKCPTPVYKIVMSDHGAGRMSGVYLHLNNWLFHNDYLHFITNKASGGLSEKTFSLLKMIFRRFLMSAFTTLRKITPSNLKDKIVLYFPRLRGKVKGYIDTALIDWTRTVAAYGENAYTFRINLRGREKNGTVREEKYQQLREKLRNELYNITDPKTQERLIERVFLREELYWGGSTNKAPDLVIIPKDFEVRVPLRILPQKNHYLLHRNRDEKYMSGTHRTNGIFIINGPNIKSDNRIENAKIYDLYPTILYLFGLAIPNEIDGKVLKDCFTHYTEPLYLDQDISRQEGLTYTYSDKDAELIQERLRDLGYLE
jgi:predicted AlkP superfamily phosphohydrolase/phosphomutase